MTTPFRALSCGVLAVAALGIACSASAQQSDSSDQSGQSRAMLNLDGASANSGSSFVGIAVGKPTYHTSCGVQGLTCSNSTTSYSVSAGNMFTRNAGVELTYLDLGHADRAGGGVSARGLNLSALGSLPLGDSFTLQGKVGATYGVTHVSAAASSGLSTGRDSGVGLGYGVALDVHLAQGLHGDLGWEQHDFHFAGQGMSNVRNVTVGLAYDF